jgi:hypothetical protein
MQDMSPDPGRIPDPSRSIARCMAAMAVAACFFGHSCIACMQARRRCCTPYGPSTGGEIISRHSSGLPSSFSARSINGVYGRHDDMFGRRWRSRRATTDRSIMHDLHAYTCMHGTDRRPGAHTGGPARRTRMYRLSPARRSCRPF